MSYFEDVGESVEKMAEAMKEIIKKKDEEFIHPRETEEKYDYRVTSEYVEFYEKLIGGGGVNTFLLLGRPGSGKTIYMLHFTNILTESYERDKKVATLPFYFSVNGDEDERITGCYEIGSDGKVNFLPSVIDSSLHYTTTDGKDKSKKSST